MIILPAIALCISRDIRWLRNYTVVKLFTSMKPLIVSYEVPCHIVPRSRLDQAVISLYIPPGEMYFTFVYGRRCRIDLIVFRPFENLRFHHRNRIDVARINVASSCSSSLSFSSSYSCSAISTGIKKGLDVLQLPSNTHGVHLDKTGLQVRLARAAYVSRGVAGDITDGEHLGHKKKENSFDLIKRR